MSSGLSRNFCYDFLHKCGYDELWFFRKSAPFLFHNLNLMLSGGRIMSSDLGTESVFQRRYDSSAVGIIFRIGACNEVFVQRKPYRESPNFNVSFLQDVEKADLNLLRQFRKLIYGKNPPVGARDQSEMDGAFIGQIPALRDLDWIDLSNDIRNGHIRRSQFFGIPVFPLDPCERCVETIFRYNFDTFFAYGRKRVVS